MQTGLHNFFHRAQPAALSQDGERSRTSNLSTPPSPYPGTVSSMLKVGMEVVHLKSRKLGKVTSLSRNSKGLIQAKVTMATGIHIVGSPSIGRDFDKVQSLPADVKAATSACRQELPKQYGKWEAFMDGSSTSTPSAEQRAEERAAPRAGGNTHLPTGSIPRGSVKPPPHSVAGEEQSVQPECHKWTPNQKAQFDREQESDTTVRQSAEAMEQDSPPTARKSKAFFGQPPSDTTQISSFFEKRSAPTHSIPQLANKKITSAKHRMHEVKAVGASEPPTRTAKQTPPKAQPKPSHGIQSGHPEVASGWVSKRAVTKNPDVKAGSFWWWLEDQHLKDACLRRPDEKEYDSSTVHIPDGAWKEMTEFQRQYWNVKRVHFDKIIFAKLGKFYELYERDADVGHRLLNLNFTHGGRDPNYPRKMICVGVPEASVESTIAKLVPLGYKVGIVEEMERSSDVKKLDQGKRVVQRQLRRVITPGTMSTEDLVGVQESRPLLSIVHCGGKGRNAEEAMFGICLVDCTLGNFVVGMADWYETESLLLQHRPFEVLHQRGGLSSEIRTWLRRCTPCTVWTAMPIGHNDEEFWPADLVSRKLCSFFSSSSGRMDAEDDDHTMLGSTQGWPGALAAVADQALAMDAVGGALSYLRALGQDVELLSLRRFEPLHGGEAGKRTCMVLDAQTLSGLDIINDEAGSGKSTHCSDPTTLWAFLNRAVTPFGRRTLRFWITHPLFRASEIAARLDAVENLLQLDGSLADLDYQLQRLPDLERKITRIHVHAQSVAKGQGVAEAAAAQKRVLKELMACMEGYQAVERIREQLVALNGEGLVQSAVLKDAIEGVPVLQEKLEHLESLFDMHAAKKDSKVKLSSGSDPMYDRAMRIKEEAESALQQHLIEEKRRLSCVKMKFAGGAKDPFFFEIPADFPAARVPADYVVESTTKACKRYSTPSLKALIDDLGDACDAVEEAQRAALRKLCECFDKDYAAWCRAVANLGLIDALHSLSKASCSYDGMPMCRPEVLDRGSGLPVLNVVGMRHPFLSGLGGRFVPNDLALGGSGQGLCGLITGPNMGGKSTTLRLACLSVVMAQIGCYVPAESCVLTAVDRIFTRLGASDNILKGLSTFMVEMRDVALVLRAATQDSLVIIDELGRGTSTFDGQAIAHAVLSDIVSRVGCRTLLSTHYHGLALDFQADSRVAAMHMACQVDAGSGQLIMLYQLCGGICPTSYGCECALRVLPKHIVDRARTKSLEFLNGHTQGAKTTAGHVSMKRKAQDGSADAQTRQKKLSTAEQERFLSVWKAVPGDAADRIEGIKAFQQLLSMWLVEGQA